MTEKIDFLNEKRKELLERINVAQNYKKEVGEKVQKLAARFSIGELNFFEYHQELKKNFGDKSPADWIEYYDKYIEKCRTELKKCGEEINELRIKKVARFSPLILVIFIFALVLYYNFKDSSILLSPSEIFTEKINFVASEDGSFMFEPQQGGRLSSLRISGDINGGGNVKIYLQANGNELLILDSDAIGYKGISGLAIEEFDRVLDENESIEKNATILVEENIETIEVNDSLDDIENKTEANSEIKKGFVNYCNETCDLDSIDLGDSYEIKIVIGGEAEVIIEEINYKITKKEVREDIEIETPRNETNQTVVRDIEKIERKNAQGKEVVVKKKQGEKNIIVETTVPIEWNVKDAGKIRVRWKEGGEEINFNGEDTNNDGIIDSITWVVSDLERDQTYEIIVITKAEHLDTDRSFVSDIYDLVKEQDGVWSESIGDGEYVRVTFEIPLDSTRDITLWSRTVSGNPRVEVYETNGNVTVASFESLNDDEYNKVYLTGLSGTQETFDLRVVDGSIELDHVIDPYFSDKVKLYFNNTATPIGGACPTGNKKMGTAAPNSVVIIWPGEFDSGVPGNTDAGQWYSGSVNRANTTLSTQIASATQSSRNSNSFGQGWMYDEDLTGLTLDAGNFSFNLSLMGGQMSAINSAERIFARISVVNCNGGNFNLVQDLTSTNIVGEISHTGGQNGWKANEGGRINHPAVSAVVNVNVNFSTNPYTFKNGEMLFIELGFGDASSNIDRTIGLRYNIANSFVVTPPFLDNTLPYAILNEPMNDSRFVVGVFNISLNATVADETISDLLNGEIYGVRNGNEADFYKHGLLSRRFNFTNGTQAVYNWTAPVVIPDASTVVLYHLDNNSRYGESQTEAVDYVSANVNLTPVGNAFPNQTSGKFAGGWEFDGNGDYLGDASNLGALNGVDNATFAAWIMRAGASSTGLEVIVQEGGQGRGLALIANCNNNMMQFGVKEGGVYYAANASTFLLNDENWHHLAGVYDGDADTIKLYFDGVLMNTTIATTDIVNPAVGIRVGGSGGGISQGTSCASSSVASSFNGTIDEVGIWNSSLTASEIKDLYRLKVGKYYWKTNVTDQIGNNNESETREFTVINSLPIISDVNATNVTQNFAMINWTTDYETNSSVNFGTNMALGTNISENILITKHNISLAGLLSNTLYFYNVTSCSFDNFCSTSGTFNFTTLALSNQAPVVNFVNFTDTGAVLGGVQPVLINFTVSDQNGFGDINDPSSKVEIYNLSLTGAVRVNSTCSAVGNVDADTRNYNCVVGMWYFDPYGMYTVNVTIRDNAGARAENSSRVFQFIATPGFTMSPNSISWPTLSPGQSNIPSIENLTINNTGNVAFYNVSITAFNLTGVTDSGNYIPAMNFWGGVSFNQCSAPATQLRDDGSVNISNAFLNTGNLSIGAGAGQEEIFFCLASVPDPLLKQTYSTEVGNPWQIELFTAALVLSGSVGRKRKRKITLENEDLLELLGDRLEELLELVKANKLRENKVAENKEIVVPLDIFKQEGGAAESLCKYLKDNKGMKFSEIARLLKRDRRTISLNYKNTQTKILPENFGENEFYVPVRIFSDRRLSILESLVSYLRNKGYKNVEIAKMLERDQRNVWTLHSRAAKKLRVENKNI